MTLKRPNQNFMRVHLNQSFPDKMKVQFIARIIEIEEDGSNLRLKITDDQGTLDLKLDKSKYNDEIKKDSIVQMFAEFNKKELQILHFNVVENFDYETYKELQTLKNS